MLQHVSAISNPCDESCESLLNFHCRSAKGKRWPWGCRRILRRSSRFRGKRTQKSRYLTWRTCRLFRSMTQNVSFLLFLANMSYSKNARFFIEHPYNIWASIRCSKIVHPKKMPLQLWSSRSRNAYIHTQEEVAQHPRVPKWLVNKHLPESHKIERCSLSLPFLECTKNAHKMFCLWMFQCLLSPISINFSHGNERSRWPITQIHLLLRESQPFSALPCNHGTGQNVLRRWTSPGWCSIFAPIMQLPSKALRTSCSQHLVKQQTLKCCASFNFKPQIWPYTSWPMNPSSPKCSYLNFHMFPKLEIGPEQRRDLFANRHPSRPRHESISPSRSLSLSPSY